MLALRVPIRHKTVIATQNICIAKGQGTVSYATAKSVSYAELINNGLFIGKIYFQHDNARPHVAKIVKK